MFDITFISILDHLGTLAFAISGIRMATAKEFDWFGAYIVGLATAIGGGTTRDLFLQTNPFWMQQSSYLIITGISLLLIIIFSKKILNLSRTLFIFDTIGLALFVVVGIEKTLSFGFPFWVAIIMGTVTGSIGGVIRDVLINEIPLLFRNDIYAMACVIGGILYFIALHFGLSSQVSGLICASTVIIIRIIAVKYKIQLPILKP